MQRIIDRFNGETGNDLKLRAGIDTGTVTSGLVGRSTLAYDMWGSAVEPGLSGAERLAAARRLRDVRRLRRDARHPAVHCGGRGRRRRRAASPSGGSRSGSRDQRLRRAVVLLGRRRGRRAPDRVGRCSPSCTDALRRRRSCLARPVSLLRNYILPLARAAASCWSRRLQVSGGGHPGAHRRDGVRLRRAGAAALGAERHPVPGRAGRNLAQADSVDLPRRRAVRADRRRRRR